MLPGMLNSFLYKIRILFVKFEFIFEFALLHQHLQSLGLYYTL